MKYQLFPIPRNFSISDEIQDWSSAEWVQIDPSVSMKMKKHVRHFIQNISKYFKPSLKITAGTPSSGKTLLSIELVPSGSSKEAYQISIKDNVIVLQSKGEPGLFYGLQTLKQFMGQTGALIPYFEIEDSPDFENRGVMLDVSRCRVPTMETFLGYIDLLSQFKINQLQLSIEHTFAFSGHEAVWYDASPLTAEDMMILDEYCQDHYIDFIPNFNSFGHVERWLKHQEYKDLAESPDGFHREEFGDHFSVGSTLKPNQQSLDFLDGLYKDFLPNFSSHYFNAGCDETWELGKGWSKPLCDEKGKNEVYLEFVKKIRALVQKYDKRMMFWGDIILRKPALIPELPSDLIALNWGYEADHPFEKETKHFADSNIPYYVCPGTASWCSLVGRTKNCLENINNAAQFGLQNNAIGLLNTDWGDRGHHQHISTSYLGLLAGSAFSWCYDKNKDADIAGALDCFVFNDSTNSLGSLFYQAGEVYEMMGVKIHNQSILNKIFFNNAATSMKWLQQTTPTLFSSCIEKINELEQKIPHTQAQGTDGTLAKEELLNGLNMVKHAAQKALCWYEGRTMTDELRHDLQRIISQYEKLWLQRNRHGGLQESSDIIRDRLND